MFSNARTLDAVPLSVGDVTLGGTAYRYGVIPEEMHQHFVRMDAVGDLLFHCFIVPGELIDNPTQGRVMSVPVDTLRVVPQRIIASGSTNKVQALLAPCAWSCPPHSSPTSIAPARCWPRQPVKACQEGEHMDKL